mgnify:CR=1 FL=1
MITDEELIERFNYWLDHYTNNGERHYSNTPDWKIQELYTDSIYDSVLNEICEEDRTEEELIERLNNLV